MCENCTDFRERIKSDLRALLDNDPENELVQAVERNLPDALKAINRRIDFAVEQDGRKRPSKREVRAAVRDCLVAAVLATGAAAIARTTPGYTDEGGLSPAMILGTWAGAIMENEITEAMEDEVFKQLKNHLGMGDN